jgi:hypothetical protein
MTITRAEVETILIRRCGSLLTAADLDGTTINGTNVDLNDPIGAALRRMEYTVASLTAVTDLDLAPVSADDVDQLLDLAELRTLENIEGNLDDVDITVGPRSESLNQLSVRVRMKIDTKRREIEKAYGLGLGTLSAGVVTLDFMEKGDGDTD